MATFVVSPGDMGSMVQNQFKAALARAVKAVQLTVATTGIRIAQEEVDVARPTPVDRGTYRRNFRVQNISNGARLYNPTPYASVIEHGRRKGSRMPPSASLAAWALRKGIAKNKAEAKSLGFVIARAVKKRGLKPLRILGKTDLRLRPFVLEAIRTGSAQ